MTPDQITQLRQVLEKVIARFCGDCMSDDCSTQEGCPYKELFHDIDQALALLPCPTCNGTKLPKVQSPGAVCPDCK